jgi:hypothetical protein
MNIRKLIVLMLILIALAVIFSFLAYLKIIIFNLSKKYPKTLNCERLGIDPKSKSAFEEFAKRDK